MTAAIYTLATLYAFWALYVLCMGFYRAWLHRRLRGLSAILASPFVAVGLAVDAVMQFTVFAIVFRELPPLRKYGRWTLPELMVTHRFQRYLRNGAPGWRARWAHKICHHLLDPFDPTGAHCDEEPAHRV